jgi:hypothetical protein
MVRPASVPSAPSRSVEHRRPSEHTATSNTTRFRPITGMMPHRPAYNRDDATPCRLLKGPRGRANRSAVTRVNSCADAHDRGPRLPDWRLWLISRLRQSPERPWFLPRPTARAAGQVSRSGKANVEDKVSEPQIQGSAAGPVDDECEQDDDQDDDHQPEEEHDDRGNCVPAYGSGSSHPPQLPGAARIIRNGSAQEPGLGQRNWDTSGIEDLLADAGIPAREFVLRFTLSHRALSTTSSAPRTRGTWRATSR